MERSDGGRRLLVWDAPDMDRCLSDVLGQRASLSTRPHLPAVLRWARGRSGRPEPLEAAVFCLVPSGLEAKMAPWVANLRHHGFAVFAKPAPARREAVTRDLVRHVERCFVQGRLVEVTVASHDATALREPLRRWRAAGVDVVLLGYRERQDFGTIAPPVAFVDVEEVPAAFEHPLPRTNLFDLPRGGRWFDPLAGRDAGTAGAGPSTPGGQGVAHPSRVPAAWAPGNGNLVVSRAAPVAPNGAAPARPAERTRLPATNAETTPPPLPPAQPAPRVKPDPPAPPVEPAPGAPLPSAAGNGSAEVVALVEAEVAASLAAGAPGVTLRHVGDLIRSHFEPRSLADLGFESVGRLVEVLEAAGHLRLIRLADGRHLLTPAAPDHSPPTPPADASTAPPTAAPAAGPGDHGPPEAGHHGSADAGRHGAPDIPAHPFYRVFRGRSPA